MDQSPKIPSTPQPKEGSPAEQPTRFSEAGEGDPIGALLRAAGSSYRAGLDEQAAWRRLQQRRAFNRLSRVGLIVGGLAAAAAVILWIRAETGTQSFEFSAAPELPSVRAPSPVQASSGVIEPVRALPPAPTARVPPPVTPAVRAPVSVPRSNSAFGIASSGNIAPSARTEADCRALSQTGDLKQAIACFHPLSQGSGLNAEVSLHEVGRLELLRSDALAALRAFDTYRERFPKGALRGEVDYGRVRALTRLGRVEDALGESEALLAKPSGRSISKELHLLRGRLYEKQMRDCEKAVTEYVALVGEPGDLGEEAELGRARCLESLGRIGDASAAYSRYLSRPSPREAGAVRQRLRDLASASETH